MNIAFFGASITQQKSGYAYHFKELNPQHKINQFGYGGMYITDAGVCFIDDVIRSKPEYCFIDWFSSACYTLEKIKPYLDTIVQKLFEIDCHPIFLFFYRKNIKPCWFNMFNALKTYAFNHNINYIDLSQIENADQYLRDSVHTNDLGSKKYAEIINQNFYNMNFQKCTQTIMIPNYLKKINVLNIKIIATQYIKLKSYGCSNIIGILQTVGPYTDKIIYTNQNQEYVLDLKDKWSEIYERETIKFHIDKFCDELIIRIPETKQLIWNKLFYTGDWIELLDFL